MTTAPPKKGRDIDDVDLLLQRLAPDELAQANAVARSGLPTLLNHAHQCLERAELARKAFDGVSRALEHPIAPRVVVVERYLRDTTTSPESLADDLAQLKKRPSEVFDLPALGERASKVATQAETAAEVALVVARGIFNEEAARGLLLNQLFSLSESPGRWSRRVAALRLLREVARANRAGPATECAQIARRLFRRDEHRWVQPLALALLAETSETEAIKLADDRIAKPGVGDDFLVRERIVSFAGRRGGAWADVVQRARTDSSEHVRLTAARALSAFEAVSDVFLRDQSHRVRAVALISLSNRWGFRAEAMLARALETDAHPVVVRTAAEQYVALARDKKLKSPVSAIEALARATERKEIDKESRERVADALIAVDVLTDTLLSSIHHLLSQVVSKVPPGGGVRLSGPAFGQATGEGLARVLSVLSQQDFALSADRTSDGIVVYRGERRRFSTWRTLFEIAHPGPSKRQGFVHTWARVPRGALRAPPGGLAELTATRVPGERVLVSGAGGWGRALPMMDDVMSQLTPLGKPALLVSSTGVTMVIPPKDAMARMVARFRATLSYPRLAELRKRSLESDEPVVQSAFAGELEKTTGVRIEFTPLAFGPRGIRVTPPPQLRPPSATGAVQIQRAVRAIAVPPIGAVGLGEFFHRLSAYASSMHSNRLPHVAAYASFLLVGMLARGVLIKRRIDADRRAVPLVLGGWGTRGKSGTERLKAGLLQGLGYEVLVKTTGCEAMFIHALPGMVAKEVFIYRPYDKATVWEQRSLLSLARRFGARSFLWECMALQPDLVNLLQAQWMRDDCSTITNAYPDHEDVQGPAGFDVAEVISEFVPTKGRLFTSEDQMLPIVRERARQRETQLTVVDARDSDLIAEDVLARFPYHEHPSNIALVVSLAKSFGITPTIALTEMADNVVPDLGVLKTYPTIEHEGRTLDFTNGMSANERTGAWSNWTRMSFDKHDPDKEPKRRIITVVNNRGDRVARSEVFARFLVEDASAHKHVLIGTNVTGLFGFIQTALEKHLDSLALTLDLAGSQQDKWRTATTRLAKALRFLKIPASTADNVLAEAASMRLPPLDAAMVSGLLIPNAPGEPVAESKRIVDAAIGRAGPFVVEMIARRRAAKSIEMALDAYLHTDPARLEKIFREAYTTLFMDAIVPLYNSALTGDQIIDTVAKLVPVGAHAAIMGVQNIKGTGLDFVYRWVSHDLVMRELMKLESGTAEEKQQALRELTVHDDYGLMDAKMALKRLEAYAVRSTGEVDALMSRLREIVNRRGQALTASRQETFGDKLRRFIGKTFDYMDSIRRQRMATDVVDDLVRGRISHAAAAIRMRDVVARAKGAWMTKKSA